MTREDKYNMLDKFALTDKLLYKLNKLDFDSSHRIRGCMNPENINNAGVCIEKYIEARKNTKTDRYTNLCKLVGMDLPSDYHENYLTIRDLFDICGRGTPINHIQFMCENTEIDAYCRYEVSLSKYALNIGLSGITLNKIPDNIPRNIEISLSHDYVFAFVKSFYSNLDNTVYFWHHASAIDSIDLTPLYNEGSVLHRRATTDFLKYIFKPIQEKWRDFALKDCPLTCTCCEHCHDVLENNDECNDDVPENDCSSCDKDECEIPCCEAENDN